MKEKLRLHLIRRQQLEDFARARLVEFSADKELLRLLGRRRYDPSPKWFGKALKGRFAQITFPGEYHRGYKSTKHAVARIKPLHSAKYGEYLDIPMEAIFTNKGLEAWKKDMREQEAKDLLLDVESAEKSVVYAQSHLRAVRAQQRANRKYK